VANDSEFAVVAPVDSKTHCIVFCYATFLLPENEQRVKNIMLNAAHITRI
jgi:hypothetical protein